MLFGYIGYYMMRQNLSAAFPLMHDALGYSNAELGLIAASSEIAYAIGKFLNGPLIDRHGGKRIFLLGMAGGIVCNLAFAYGTSLPWFIACWCACRYFLSMGWGSVTKTLGHWYAPRERGTVMGFASLSLHFGGVAAALFAGWLASRGQSWDRLFTIPALILCIVWLWAALASRARPQDVARDDSVPGRSITAAPWAVSHISTGTQGSDTTSGLALVRELLLLPVVRSLMLFSFMSTALRSIFLFWTPTFLHDLGMGSAAAVFSSALFPLMGGIGVVALGWYTDRYAPDNRVPSMLAMLFGLFAALLGIAALSGSASGDHASVVVLLGAAGFFLLGPYSMPAGCLTLDIVGPRAAGTCVGLVDGVGYLGGALAAWAVGAASEQLGWSSIFVGLACAVLPLFAAAWSLKRHFAAPRAAADAQVDASCV